MRNGKGRAPDVQSVTFRTPGEAANYLHRRHPFAPGDKLTAWDLVALQTLMAASDMPEGYMTADDVNDLVERWLPQ